MDAQDIRNLQEAYMEVVENQQLDEEQRPIYGRGGKLRRTETSLEVLGKHATARDKKMKHNIPRGGRTFPAGKPEEGDPSSLFSGEYDRGKGSKAARRAAALKKPEPKKSFPNRLRRSDGQGIQDSYDYYDIILSHLLDEGYADNEHAALAIMVNMSEEWREEIVEARKKVKIHTDKPIHYKIADIGPGKKEYNVKTSKGWKEEVDIYDIILSHLLDEGYVDNEQAALAIMVNMSEEWRESIVEEKKPYPEEKVARKREAVKKKEDIAAYQRRDNDANTLYKRGVALAFKKKMSEIGRG